MRTIVLLLCCCWLGSLVLAAELPSPKNGGPGGKPMALLVFSDNAVMDAQYEKELTNAGYRVEKTSYSNKVSMAYLQQFGAIILSRLPYAGEQYEVGGEKLAYLEENLNLIHEYLAQGGGVLFEPAVSEFGEAYADIYNSFLKRYDAAYLTQQVRDDAETKGAYAAGIISGKHPISQGLTDMLYPINVLRWDHAYSTTALVTGPAWTVLAAGKKTAGTVQAVDNANVSAPLTTEHNLFAIRKCGKGYLAISGIHSYYTLTDAYSTAPNLGENNTGRIDGIVLHGEKGGRPSDFCALLDRTYRFLAANSAQNGLGSGTVALPAQPPTASTSAVLDWHTVTPPPTWQHRVQQAWVGSNAYYDELPDTTVQGPLQYYKALIGPRTSYSTGSGSVKEYRAAAIKAGYSAIVFCEVFSSLTKEKWAQLPAIASRIRTPPLPACPAWKSTISRGRATCCSVFGATPIPPGSPMTASA